MSRMSLPLRYSGIRRCVPSVRSRRPLRTHYNGNQYNNFRPLKASHSRSPWAGRSAWGEAVQLIERMIER